MSNNNFKRFSNGIHIARGLTSDPVTGEVSEIYHNTTSGVLRICVNVAPLTWQDLYIKDGTVDNATLVWDSATSTWIENTSLLINNSSIETPSSVSPNNIQVQPGIDISASNDGQDVLLSGGMVTGTGVAGQVVISGRSLALSGISKTGDPTVSSEADIYYNSTDKLLKFYDGASWKFASIQSGTVTNSSLHWDGTQWSEDTTILINSGSIFTSDNIDNDAVAANSINLNAGNKTSGTGVGGSTSLLGGSSVAGVGGTINLTGGSSSTGAGGDIVISGGTSTSSDNGDIFITARETLIVDYGKYGIHNPADLTWGAPIPGFELDGTTAAATTGWGTGLILKGNSSHNAHLLLISENINSGSFDSANIYSWSGDLIRKGLTGSIDPTASVNVVGVGTLFVAELTSGDTISVSGEDRIVDVITDDTNLTVTVAFSDNANDASPEVVPTGNSGQVVLSSGAVYDGGGNSGLVNMASGYAPTGNSGSATIGSNIAGVNSGNTTIKTGNSIVAGISGNVDLLTGTSLLGNTGGINLITGTPTSGTRGDITLNAKDILITGYGKITISDFAPTFWGVPIPALEFDGTTAAAANGWGAGIVVNGSSEFNTNAFLATNQLLTGTFDTGGVSIWSGTIDGTATGNTGFVGLQSGDNYTSGDTGGASIGTGWAGGAGQNSGTVSIASGVGNVTSGRIDIVTGPATTSGNIDIRTGTGATRGDIQLRNGSEGTSGHIWTSTGILGEGGWAAAPASGANVTLSNLTSPTSVNQSLIPSAAGKHLGDSTSRWGNIWAASSITMGGNSAEQIEIKTLTSPSAISSFAFKVLSGAKPLALFTENKTAAINSTDVLIETGNVDTGTSGDIILRPGVPSGAGTMGKIRLLGDEVVIPGKLTVVGGIDPEYLQLTPQANDSSIPNNSLWIDSGDSNKLKLKDNGGTSTETSGGGPKTTLIKGGTWTNEDTLIAETASENVTDTNEVTSLNTSTVQGQSFTAPKTGFIDTISFKMRQSGSGLSGNIRVSVYSDTGSDVPDINAGPIASSDNIDITTLPTVDGEVVFNFSTSAEMTLSTKYHAIVNISSIVFSGGTIYSRMTTSSTIADGARIFSSGGLAHGAFAEIATHELVFNVKTLTLPTQQLTFDSDAFVQIGGLTDTSNKLIAASYVLADGEVLYITPNIVESSPATITPLVDVITNIPSTGVVIIARREGTDIIVNEDARLSSGEQAVLYEHISTLNPSLLGGGNISLVGSEIVVTNDPGSTVDWDGIQTNQDYGQSFEIPTSALVSSVEVLLRNNGSADYDLTMNIYAGDGANPELPTGPSLGTSDVIAATSITGTAAFYSFNFPTTPSLIGVTSYVYMINSSNVITQDGANRILIQATATNTYDPTADGRYRIIKDVLGVFTATSSRDTAFKIHTSGGVVFDSDFFVQLNGNILSNNTIPTTQSLFDIKVDGEVAYVTPNRTGNANLTVQIGAASSVGVNDFIIAQRVNSEIIVGDNLKVVSGKPSTKLHEKSTAQEISAKYWNPVNTEWKVMFDDMAAKDNTHDQSYGGGTIGLTTFKSGTGATMTPSAIAYTDRFGVNTVKVGTSAGAITGWETWGDKTYRFGDGRIKFGCAIKILDIPIVTTDDWTLNVGPSDAISTFAGKASQWLLNLSANVTNWNLSNKGTSTNTVDSGIAFGTDWINLEIDIAADLSSVKYYADGVLIYTETTAANIPAAGTQINFNITGRTNTGMTIIKGFECDWVYLAIKPTNTRGNIAPWIDEL